MNPQVLALRETVLGVVDVYNLSVWPLQVFAAVAALAAMAFIAIKPGPAADATAKIVFDLIWLYIGAVFFVGHFIPQIKWAWIGAILFALQGTLFIADALYGGLEFRIRIKSMSTLLALACVATAGLYPLLGWLFGRGWPYSPLPASAPGPTALLTIGLLLMARGRRRWFFIIIPALWAIGASLAAAAALHLYEDYALAAAAFIAVTYMAFFSYKTKPAPSPSA